MPSRLRGKKTDVSRLLSEKIRHKDTKEPQRDFVKLCAFAASWQKNGCVPPFIRKN
ncbi:Uncharacterized protein dnm_081860 [Desulfonema magnum]|uniref:Uncharacterized protein n=1 Tax=Desulfonema magnum TaxID=45655 RepID=A0A975GSI8_9BACT|nr:Uncharacterized protein dnm_081860 [Desulfonema magnum]